MRPQLKMFRDLGLLGLGQLATKGVTFVAFAVLARKLQPEDYGAVEYALGVGALGSMIIEGGFGSVGVRRIAQGQGSTPFLAALVPAGQLCLVALVVPAMLLFGWLFAQDPRALPLIAAVSLSVALLPWRQEWLFQAVGKMGHIATSQILRAGVFALGVLLLTAAGAGVGVVGVAEVVSVAAAVLYMMVVQQRAIAPVRLAFAPKDLADLGREGLPIGAGAVCWALTQYMPLLMLTAIAGFAATAYFGAAHRLGVSLIAFSWIYHFNLYPTLARKMGRAPDALASLVRASVRSTAWVGAGVALGLTLCAEPLLALLFGSRFGVAAPAFSILVWTLPITLVSGHARWLLVAAGRSHDTLIAQAAGVAAAILAGWLMIPRFGGLGAAAAMSLASLTVWLTAQAYVIARGQQVPIRLCLWPAAVALGVVLVSHGLAFNPWVETAAGVAVFTVLGLVVDPAVLRDLAHIGSAKDPAADGSEVAGQAGAN
jgi:O-antigen/teichoic acid export membrane protein